MNLEVGMYVRTKRDGIGKIISLSIGEEDECCFIELSKRRTGIKEHNIVKASHNIIDLIEVGDYVNGYKVCDVDEFSERVNYIYIVDKFDRYEDENTIILYEKNIKDVLTKEQYETMAYKVV